MVEASLDRPRQFSAAAMDLPLLPPFVLLEDRLSSDGGARLFTRQVEVVCCKDPDRFDAVLNKPVRDQALFDCLSRLIAGDDQETVVEAAPTQADAEAEIDVAPFHQPRVLLAEDNAINTLLATTLLDAAGCQVETVVQGAEALEAVQIRHFDLILMDVSMPVMDGLEATRRIRALAGRAGSTPIVAMTANAMASDRDNCIDAGMNDFVSKPFEADAFLRVVGRYVAPEADNQDTGGSSSPPVSAARSSRSR